MSLSAIVNVPVPVKGISTVEMLTFCAVVVIITPWLPTEVPFVETAGPAAPAKPEPNPVIASA